MSRRRNVAVAITAAVGALVGYQARALPNPEGAQAVHLAIREAAAAVPVRALGWESSRIPATEAAVKLLKPNVLDQRRWLDPASGRSVEVLLVHCGDTRDMLGHYPPVCYPGQGWRLAVQGTWRVDLAGLSHDLPQYEFVMVRGTTVDGLVVRNAMLLPGEGLGRNMDDVNVAARDVRRRFLGAGQIQLVFRRGVSEGEMNRVTAEIMDIYRPVLETLAGAGRSATDGAATAEEK